MTVRHQKELSVTSSPYHFASARSIYLTLAHHPLSPFPPLHSYPINLQAFPFSLPPPLADYDERTPVAGQASKHLLLYSGKQLEEINWDEMLIAVGG